MKLTLATTLFALVLAGCGDDTKAAWRDAGEATENALEKTGDEIKENAKEARDDVRRKIHEATEPDGE